MPYLVFNVSFTLLLTFPDINFCTSSNALSETSISFTLRILSAVLIPTFQAGEFGNTFIIVISLAIRGFLNLYI